jgi:hypothetical protein
MTSWTVLVYLAGDNGRILSSLEGEGVADLAEMKQVGSSEAVQIAAQFDAGDRGCRRYHLSKGGALANDTVQDLGDTNSGDAQSLIDFITWGVRSFPAQRYVLVLWNHGSGWRDDDVYGMYRTMLRRGGLPPVPPEISGRRAGRALFRRTLDAIVEEEANQAYLVSRARRGADTMAAGGLPPGWRRPAQPGQAVPLAPVADLGTVVRSPHPAHARAICFDDSSKDFLDSQDLTAVLKAATALLGKRVDVLGMDACLMSMIEVAYQVRDGAGVMVASEDVEPGNGWPYGDILATLNQNPQMSAAELGKAIAIAYAKSYDSSFLATEPVTQSALDLQQAPRCVAALNELALALLGGWRQRGLRSALADARARAQTFMDADYVDLFDFVSLLAAKTSARAVRDACEHVLASVDPGKPGSLVLADAHAGLAERNAHGLSIYCPKSGLSPFYANLDLSRDCAWARFLDTCLG